MVSFVTDDFYKTKLQQTCGRVKKGHLLALRAANGLEIPYVCYLELDAEVDGVKVPDCGVLVLKDTPATVEQSRKVPGLLGTNVLARLPKFAELLESSSSKPRVAETKTSGFVRVAGRDEVLVPSSSVTNVLVSGPVCGPRAVVEPLRTPVPGNIQIANTLVDTSSVCYYIQVVNPTSKDVWLKPKTRLGAVCDVAGIPSRED